MKEKHLYICENSTTGIFTGIYDAWEARYGHENNRILVEEPGNYELFTKMIYVKPDLDKAEKVKNSIRKKISNEAYITVFNATLSKDKAKADVIYRFLIIGFAMGKGVMGYLTNPYVSHLLKMDKNVNMERLHYQGFVRFVKLGSHILLSRIRPENDILIALGEHFADRLSGENWVMYDESRKKAAVHQAHGDWFVAEDYELNLEKDMDQLEQEDEFLSMWKRFVDSIAIQERTNEKLQLNMLPNRYREFMPEVEYKKKNKM